MIHRRTLLTGIAGLAVSSLLASCSRSADSLKITLLEGAVPQEILRQFRNQIAEPVDLTTLAQTQRIFQRLQRWQQTPTENASFWQRFLPGNQAATAPVADTLVSLGDYWLKAAIAQDLIEPLTLPDETWELLPFQWQQFVSRDATGQSISPDNAERQRWAAPYKVQSLVIVYRQSQYPAAPSASTASASSQSPFQQWRDLLDPELRQRIALPDHPNLALGLLQKIETGSFNTSFNSLVNSSASTTQLVQQLNDELSEPFAQLNQQVRTYDASNALKALINEDVDIVIAWSGDVTTALRRYQDLRAVVPAEGSLLSADLWVQPKGALLSEAAKQWIAFCWESGPATQLSISSRGISPVFLGEEVILPTAVGQNLLAGPALQNSEPLLLLPDAMQAAYVALWKQLRTG
ncbi:MAG: extracellular solute-binding protein [Cyanobacteria bacterium J06649_4]